MSISVNGGARNAVIPSLPPVALIIGKCQLIFPRTRCLINFWKGEMRETEMMGWWAVSLNLSIVMLWDFCGPKSCHVYGMGVRLEKSIRNDDRLMFMSKTRNFFFTVLHLPGHKQATLWLQYVVCNLRSAQADCVDGLSREVKNMNRRIKKQQKQERHGLQMLNNQQFHIFSTENVPSAWFWATFLPVSVQ